ncbi:MAG TPA: hypothetical protein VHS59_01430, partial [Bacillota bacterium]|nr:hypothetical protein [Bacillota bacterium]
GSRYPAVSTAAKLLIDGRPQSIASFNIDGNNYVRLRDLSRLIHFEVVWDAKANTIKLYSPTPTNAHRLDLTYSVNDSGASWAFPRWKSTLTSYLVKNADKTISVVEANEGIIIQTYDQAYKPISRKKVAYELPLFGGFFSGEKYNYIAFGQENREEKDAKEVIRIVRYDKAFQRIDSVSVKGGESFTIVPFDAGCGRMAEYGNTLVFHTSRTRYTTEDGLNHQSQLTIIVDTSSMTVTNDLGRFQSNHVSHSFDQYVQYDGTPMFWLTMVMLIPAQLC